MGWKLTIHPPEVPRFWEKYREKARLPRDTPWEAWAFGDNPKLADELLHLVLIGKKRGTADLVAEVEANGDPLPEIGGTASSSTVSENPWQ